MASKTRYDRDREKILAQKREYYLANPEGHRLKSRRYREANPEKAAASLARSQRKRMDCHIAAMNALKSAGCTDCGGPGEHFHHRDPLTKAFDIADGYLVKAKRLDDEIEKCDILCQACHHERHRLLRLAS